MSEANVSDIAEQYYDSSDADNFYFRIWGGEDLHVGTYQSAGEPIRQASDRTVENMAAKIAHLPADAKVLDIGAGFGGSARTLARKFGWKVDALNISKVQNERNRKMCREQGLDHLIEVFDGNFEELPFEANTYDAVWCQDSILHSSDRFKVFAEVDRVLKPGGEFIFTDPMQQPNASREELAPVLARIHLPSLGSVNLYEDYAKQLGWSTLSIERMPEQIANHYGRVLDELDSRYDELTPYVSESYLERMKTGLKHWIDAGRAHRLDWGILHFKKN